MHLFFLRHGIAEDGSPGQPDAERRLTPDGTARMRQEAETLARLDLRLKSIYTSPFLRTMETAHIVQAALSLPDVTPAAGLASGAFRLSVLQSLFRSQPPNARFLLVGHQPDLSEVVGQLTGAAIELKKGGLAYVEAFRLEPAGGVLRWLLPPSLLTGQPDDQD